MISPEALEKLLENPIVRLVAGFGFVLLVTRLLTSLFFNVIGIAGVFESFFYDSIWRIRYIEALAAILTIAGWIVLSLTRRFEQPWWMLVAGALVLWVFLVTPLASSLNNRLWQALGVVAVAAQGVAALLALVAIDKAVPKMTPATTQPVQVPVSQQQETLQPTVQQPTVQQQGPQPAGWYEDPRGQAKWRWWDGQNWTENTG